MLFRSNAYSDSNNTSNLALSTTRNTTKDSYNTTTTTDSHNKTYTNTWIATDLSAATSNVSVSGTGFHSTGVPSMLTGNNSIDQGAFGSTAGIAQVSLNSGLSAVVQQSVNVLAPVTAK